LVGRHARLSPRGFVDGSGWKGVYKLLKQDEAITERSPRTHRIEAADRLPIDGGQHGKELPLESIAVTVTATELGTAVGVGLPLLVRRRRHDADSRSAGIVVTPLPLGVAGTF
jgi:hypothetical protein